MEFVDSSTRWNEDVTTPCLDGDRKTTFKKCENQNNIIILAKYDTGGYFEKRGTEHGTYYATVLEKIEENGTTRILTKYGPKEVNFSGPAETSDESGFKRYINTETQYKMFIVEINHYINPPQIISVSNLFTRKMIEGQVELGKLRKMEKSNKYSVAPETFRDMQFARGLM